MILTRAFGEENMVMNFWKGLRKGGILISDDIEDNLSFSRFVKRKKSKFAVIQNNNKYIGLAIK